MYLNTHFSLIVLTITLTFQLFTGCSSEINPNSNNDYEQIKYLALGDSYTIGTGIEEQNSYPNQLTDSLISRGFKIDSTQIIAVNGWTTTNLKEGIEVANPDSTFNMVSLLIGVNNQYQGLELDLYRNEFRELLEQAIAFAGGDTSNVWVISIPNYGVTPFAESRNPITIGQELEVYNTIASDIATEYGVPFENVTPISELARNDSSLLASDELHPSSKMYAMWVKEMMPTVTKIIQQ